MNYEVTFSLAGLLAIFGWATLFSSPFMPVWSNRLAGFLIPALLSVGYLFLLLAHPAENGGFGSFADIPQLFSNPNALLAGWVHFLAFDLVVGAWICRTRRAEGIRFWMVLPCLPVTFLFGPAGFLCFSGMRVVNRRRAYATD